MNRFDLKQNLPDYLIFGQYPAVILAPSKQDKIFKAYEFKWSKTNVAKINKFWQEPYHGQAIELINNDNYLDFIT